MTMTDQLVIGFESTNVGFHLWYGVVDMIVSDYGNYFSFLNRLCLWNKQDFKRKKRIYLAYWEDSSPMVVLSIKIDLSK